MTFPLGFFFFFLKSNYKHASVGVSLLNHTRTLACVVPGALGARQIF